MYREHEKTERASLEAIHRNCSAATLVLLKLAWDLEVGDGPRQEPGHLFRKSPMLTKQKHPADASLLLEKDGLGSGRVRGRMQQTHEEDRQSAQIQNLAPLGEKMSAVRVGLAAIHVIVVFDNRMIPNHSCLISTHELVRVPGAESSMRVLNNSIAFLAALILPIVLNCVVFGQDAGYDCPSVLNAKLTAALNRIRTVEGSYVMAIDDDSRSKHSRLDGAGRQIFHSWKLWRFDRNRKFQILDGDIGSIIQKSWYYHRQVFSWDGTDHVAYNGTRKSALINGDPWETFSVFKSPCVLLGDNLVGEFKTSLTDILSANPPIEIEAKDTMSRLFDWSLTGTSAPTHKLMVTLDSQRGFLPREIIIEDLNSRTRLVHVVVERFAKVSPGIWFPTQGTLTNFQAVPIIGADSEEKATKASTKEIPEQKKRAEFREAKVGVGTMYIKIVPESLRVNKEFLDEAFRFELPDSTRSWDPRKAESVD